MTPETNILLAIALLLGVVLVIVEWAKNRSRSQAEKQSKTIAPHTIQKRFFKEPGNEETGSIETASTSALENEWAPRMQARMQAIEQKTTMAHDRIQRIERIVQSLPVEQLNKALDLKELEQKVERLNEFKNTVHVRVTLLEEELQKQKKMLKEQETEHKTIDWKDMEQLEQLEKELQQQDRELKALENKIRPLVKNPSRKN